MADPSAAGWGGLLQGRNALRSLALAGGVALHAVNVYVTITILPSVVADIGGLDYYAWNTSLFILASIMGSALSPRVLASLGPRGGYRFATVVFAAGAVVCAIAPSMPVLLIGRTVQGFGGGVLFALSYAMIRVVFAEPLWPRAMALISSMWGAATLLGPALGGIFAEFDIWRGAFWALPVLAVPYVLLTNFALPRKEERESSASGALPLRQLVLLAAAVLAISIGSVGDDPIRNGIGLAAAVIVSAILDRRRATSPDAPSPGRLLQPGGGPGADLPDDEPPRHRHAARDLRSLFPAGPARRDAADRGIYGRPDGGGLGYFSDRLVGSRQRGRQVGHCRGALYRAGRADDARHRHAGNGRRRPRGAHRDRYRSRSHRVRHRRGVAAPAHPRPGRRTWRRGGAGVGWNNDGSALCHGTGCCARRHDREPRGSHRARRRGRRAQRRGLAVRQRLPSPRSAPSSRLRWSRGVSAVHSSGPMQSTGTPASSICRRQVADE